MKLPRSLAVVPELEQLPSVGSTNDVLVEGAATRSDFSVVVTDDQTAGRGRLGREWIAPAGKCLAVSVLLRPVLPGGEPLALEHFGWLPLLGGVAMARAVQPLVTGSVGLKWPNDVQIDGLKISGLLAELLATGDAVVLGAGVNLSLTDDELPTATATSLVLQGASEDGLADAVLASYLGNLRDLYSDFVRVGADVIASGVRELVREYCTTLGQEVRVQLPGAGDLVGTATDIDRFGRLQVRRASDGAVQTVAAGDVTHLRYE